MKNVLSILIAMIAPMQKVRHVLGAVMMEQIVQANVLVAVVKLVNVKCLCVIVRYKMHKIQTHLNGIPPIRRAVGKPYEMAGIKGAISSYDGTGYIVDLTNNATKWSLTIEQLRQSNWIDPTTTRAIIISYLVYCGNYNYYLESNFIMEFSAGGGVQTHYSHRGLQMDMYNSDEEKFVAAVDGIMVAVAILIVLYQLRILRLYYETYKNLRDSLALIPKSSYLDVFISLVIVIAESIRLTLFLKDVRVKIATTVGPPQEVTDIGEFVDLYELQFQFDMIVLLGFFFSFH